MILDNTIDDVYIYNIYSKYLRDLPPYVNTNIFKDNYREIIEEIQNFQEVDIDTIENYDKIVEENNENESDYDSQSEYSCTDSSDSEGFDDDDGWITA